MANKPLRFHPEAEQEYLTSLRWYRNRSLTAAVNFEQAFGRAITAIHNAPRRWPIYFDNFRKYTLHQFPFSILYQEFPSEVVVFAIAHGRRRPAIGAIDLECDLVNGANRPLIRKERE